MERTETHPISDASLITAIATKCATCYGALAICRGLSGAEETDEWWLMRNHTIKQMLEEADKRGLDLLNTLTEIDKQPLYASMKYKHARGLINDAELRRYRRDLSAGRIEI
jgi:hypothetical protein